MARRIEDGAVVVEGATGLGIDGAGVGDVECCEGRGEGYAIGLDESAVDEGGGAGGGVEAVGCRGELGWSVGQGVE